MISVSRISFVLIAPVLFAFNALSQLTKISEKDLTTIVNSATTASSLLPRREKALTEIFKDKASPDGEIGIFTKTFLPPDKSQVFYSRETATGKYVDEWITIGSKVYVKWWDGVWRQEIASAPPPPKAISPPALLDGSVTIVSRHNVLLNKSATEFYEVKKTTPRGSKNSGYKAIEINRYWINKNGTLAKLQTEYFQSNSPELDRRTVVYEYDPSIKIEAPAK